MGRRSRKAGSVAGGPRAFRVAFLSSFLTLPILGARRSHSPSGLKSPSHLCTSPRRVRHGSGWARIGGSRPSGVMGRGGSQERPSLSQLEDQQCHTVLWLAGENLPWLSNCCPWAEFATAGASELLVQGPAALHLGSREKAGPGLHVFLPRSRLMDSFPAFLTWRVTGREAVFLWLLILIFKFLKDWAQIGLIGSREK